MSADHRELIRELAELVRDSEPLHAVFCDYFAMRENTECACDYSARVARRDAALRRAEAWLAEADASCNNSVEAPPSSGRMGGHADSLSRRAACPPRHRAAPASEPVGDQCRPELGIAQAVRFAHDAGARVGELEAQLAERDAEVARLREENEGYRKLHANQFQTLQVRREQNAKLAAELAEAQRDLAAASDATGLAGVDEPLSLLDAVTTLRQERDAAQAALAQAQRLVEAAFNATDYRAQAEAMHQLRAVLGSPQPAEGE